MTMPQIQRQTQASLRVTHTASTQSTGEIRIPVSELRVWQHVDSRDSMRRAKKDIEEGRIEDFSARLKLHKGK